MKNNKLTVPLSMTATLAFVIACNLSCGRKTMPVEGQAPGPETPTTNAPAETPATAVTNATATPDTNAATAAATAVAMTTNPPSTTVAPPPAPEPAPTQPVAKPEVKVVEMPATVPSAPTNFYSADVAKNQQCCSAFATNSNYYFRFRAGYQHVNHGDNNDTWFASVKFYARPDDLRARAGKNAWLIPDAEAELAHEYLAKPDGSAHPGSAEGVSFRADFFWPWMHWTTRMLTKTNAICPFCQPLALGLGPVAEVGFDKIFDSTDARLVRYAGARLTLNRDGFIEYTVGGTDGLAGTRQELAAELPFYTSRDGEVRYVLRGAWNRADGIHPDVLSGGIFLEMPFSTFTHPRKWSDLIPFWD